METIGKRIVYHRKRLGLTQDQLAEQLGITAQAVSKWENDQTCPDITMLPKLADIFGISTDTLLGHSAQAVFAPSEVLDSEEEKAEKKGIDWEFQYEGGKKTTMGFGLFVLTVGVLTLLSNLLHWDASFWEILWPTAILAFGAVGLYPKFSFFRLGCGLLGGYFLLCNLGLFELQALEGILFPAMVILFGLSLLADVSRRPKKDKFKFNKFGSSGNSPNSQLEIDEDCFTFDASFGESAQLVQLDELHTGSISTSFGSYTVDLTGVKSLGPDCKLSADCSFGELTLLIPKRFNLRPASSTAFAEIEITGVPDEEADGIILLNASASFGSIQIKYI